MYIDYYIYIITYHIYYEKQSSASDSSVVSEIRYIETLKRFLHDFQYCYASSEDLYIWMWYLRQELSDATHNQSLNLHVFCTSSDL